MRVLLATAALVVVAGAASVSLEDLEFHVWKLKFGKSYGSVEEESRRKMIWLDNLKLVLEHNLLADQGIKSYRLGMNQFADMDNQEYQARFSGCMGPLNVTKTRSATVDLRQAEKTDLPTEVDWRRAGYVTPVKNQQKHCDSCWAFSATGALEGQIFRKIRKLISLSEQQLVDCSKDFGNNGCQRGWPHKAFEYIIYTGGLETENTYPYQAENGVCHFKPQNAMVTCRGFTLDESGDENYLQRVVATIGPISVGIDDTKPTFRLYESGVYNEPGCNSLNLNHAVLVVGYGTVDNKEDYWLVKNSWGPEWGEKGYIKMSRNNNNQCGIASYVLYPKV
ncbi:hypothetical protein NFI96_034275 [Prochilodus magdalenae]|nr:hypothetical protein NFI96_034275 [Prochilodus magdalenae]